jgi:hypothetical protein
VPGEAGEGQVHLTSIAVSRDQKFVAGLSPSRKVVYYGLMHAGTRLARRPTGAGVTSLSWDDHDELWVASPGGVTILRPGRQPVTPGLTLGTYAVVSQLRVAPDGVRVAMIVHSQGVAGSQLLIAAINRPVGGSPFLGQAQVSIGTDVPDPTQLTWYDANNLIVLSGPPNRQQLYEVPVSGGSSTEITTYQGMQSITAAGPGVPMAAGLAHDRLALEPNLNGAWTPRGAVARSPAYPG